MEPPRVRQPAGGEVRIVSYERDAAGYVKVAPADAIPPGQGRTVEAAGWWVAVFNAGGSFYAIDNACPHNAGPLGAGRLDGTVVTCPLHAWRIDVTTGRCTSNEHARVARFDAKESGGWVWVRLLPPERNTACTPQP